MHIRPTIYSVLWLVVILSVIFFISVKNSQNKPIETDDSVSDFVKLFEEKLAAGMQEKDLSGVWGFFLDDQLPEEEQLKDGIVENLPQLETLNFKMIGYTITNVAKNSDSHYSVTVEEDRDYGSKSEVYGYKFVRELSLERQGSMWKIESYSPKTNPNTYSGGLGGSTKYTGFYP